MDVRRAVRRAAEPIDVARDPRSRAQEGIPHEVAGGCDDALGCTQISVPRDRLVVPLSLAGRTSPAKHQNRLADGPPALPDSRARPQRILHAPGRLQPDPW